MNDDDVPVKTDQGVAEIQTRKIGLARRMRTALLLVDGVKSVGELKRLLQAPDEEQPALDTLLGQGLIQFRRREAVKVPAPEKSAVAAPEIKPAAAPISTPQPERKPKPEVKPEIKREVKREATPAPKPKAKRETGPNTVIKRNTKLRVDTKLKQDTQLNTKARLNPRTRIKVKPAPELKPASAALPGPLLIEERLKARIPAATVAPPVVMAPAVVRHDMKLTIARAHLANALDDHLGIDGYILKQGVMGCTTRAELETLFETIEKDLRPVIYSVAALDVIYLAKSILEN